MIYFDNAATHPLLPMVKKNLIQNLDKFGNPSSIHSMGLEAWDSIEHARQCVASALGCDPSQIIFTSGATESNNLAMIVGWKQCYLPHSTALEHASMLCAHKINHTSDGRAKLISTTGYYPYAKKLYCVSWVNNEIGVEQDIFQLAEQAHKENNLILVDATAIFGYENVNLKHCLSLKLGSRLFNNSSKRDAMIPDFISFSGHKFGALKGVGVLYCKNPKNFMKVSKGGNQEQNLRPGTENVLGILSLKDALIELGLVEASVSGDTYHSELKKYKQWTTISHYICKNLSEIEKIIFHSHKYIAGHIINVAFEGVDSFSLQQVLSSEGICVSTGAACSGEETTYSHVLTALEKEKRDSIRISVGHMNTLEEAKILCDSIKNQVHFFRN